MKTQLQPSVLQLQIYLPRLVALCLLAAILLALAGCKNQPDKLTSLDAAGVYTLASVDGKAVRCEISHEGATMQVRSGTFSIQTNGTCSTSTTFSVENHQAVTRVVKAAWTCRGAELVMKWERAGTTIGTVNGNAFTMTNEGLVFSYRKTVR